MPPVARAVCQWCGHRTARPPEDRCPFCGELPSLRKLARIARRRRRGAELGPRTKRNVHIALEERDGKGCFYCGSAAPLTIDNAIPRSAGGKNARWNLRRACATCNKRKGSLSEEEFLKLVTPRVGSAAWRRAMGAVSDA